MVAEQVVSFTLLLLSGSDTVTVTAAVASGVVGELNIPVAFDGAMKLAKA